MGCAPEFKDLNFAEPDRTQIPIWSAYRHAGNRHDGAPGYRCSNGEHG
ncbi:MAG: hypothetical protein ACTS81_03285 [Arsenophonus sp. ER-BJ3-MAG3]